MNSADTAKHTVDIGRCNCPSAPPNVRFTPITDKREHNWNVSYVPKAANALQQRKRLLDHLGGLYDRHALNLDKDAGVCKIRYGNQCATRKFSIGENLLADLDEGIAVPRIIDRNRHCN